MRTVSMSDGNRTINVLNSAQALEYLEEHIRDNQEAIASRDDVDATLLHYIAQKGAAATRLAVARNSTAHPDTNLLLADDDDPAVRCALAKKIGHLFPGLLMEEQKRLRDITLRTLHKLARDEVAAVRAILAEEIKSLSCVPYAIIKELAKDSDPTVASSILEFSPRLDDRLLIEVVAGCRASTVLSAVARRKSLSEDVSDAVAATLDIGAVADLLANTSATLRTKTLDKLISNAADIAEWHGPLVLRPELSQSAIKKLSSFVASSYLETLASRTGLERAVIKHLHRQLERRKKTEPGKSGDMEDSPTAELSNDRPEAILIGAIEGNRKDVAVNALSALAKIDAEIVRKILASGSGEAVTALVWKCGLPMRVAFELQTKLMRLQGGNILYPRNGSDFPIPEERLQWLLQFWNI